MSCYLGRFEPFQGHLLPVRRKTAYSGGAAGGGSSVLTASQAVTVQGKEVVIEDEGDA